MRFNVRHDPGESYMEYLKRLVVGTDDDRVRRMDRHSIEKMFCEERANLQEVEVTKKN